MRNRLLAVATLLLFAAGVITARQNGNDLYQQGLARETAGDIKGAIQIFERIVREFPSNRTLTARALLQLGRWSDLLGQNQARRYYEQVIRDYADQSEPAAQARARLAEMTPPNAPAAPAAVGAARPLPGVGAMTLAVSRDATKAVVRDTSKGQNLAVHEFSNGQRRLLTELDWIAGLIDFPVWSPDGRQVAYQQNNYQQDKTVVSELRVTTLDGRSSAAHRVELYGGVQPVGWTPDGATLIVVVGRPDKTWTVGTLPATGGQFTPLRSFGWAYDSRVGSPRVSPDGRFIAYLEGERGLQDVHVVSLDGRQTYRITTDPADDFAPLWSPDNRHLAFKSNRLGAVSLWTVEVKDGQPVGQPVKLKDGMQSARMIDWTEQGIVYVESFATSDLFTVPVDPVEGRPTGSARPIPYSRTGRNVSPAWSPDGERLAFVSSGAAEPNRRYVVVMPPGGGQIREFLIPTTSSLTQDLRWFGNGRGLGLSGRDTRGTPAVFRLLLDTGEWHTTPVSDRETIPTWTEWNHDGSRFYFVRYGQGSSESGIVERAVNGDAQRLVYRMAPGTVVRALQFSPDRKWLAFLQGTLEANTVPTGVLIVDVGTGESRVVVEPVPGSNGGNLVGWTPSGDLLVQKPGSGSTTRETLLVPLGGGPPRPFAIPSIGPTLAGEASSQLVAKWSPDGRTMVVARTGQGGETFVIENPQASVRAQTVRR